MSAVDNTPENRNFLSPLNFKFTIKKAPHVNFFIQKANIAEMALPSPIAPNEFVKAPYPGDHINFGKLNITFKVDEDLQNYLEIHNWIKGLGFPETYDQYKELETKPFWTGESIYSEISLMILSSTKMANYEVIYTDAYPVLLSQLEFDTTDEDVKYMTASASFDYTYYSISKI